MSRKLDSPPCGNSRPLAAVTLIFNIPDRAIGASGRGLLGVGVVERDPTPLADGVGVEDEFLSCLDPPPNSELPDSFSSALSASRPTSAVLQFVHVP